MPDEIIKFDKQQIEDAYEQNFSIDEDDYLIHKLDELERKIRQTDARYHAIKLHKDLFKDG